jgi:hypothetical protein
MGYLARRGVPIRAAPALRTAMIYGSVMASFCVEGFSYDRLRRARRRRPSSARFEAFSALTNFERASLLD